MPKKASKSQQKSKFKYPKDKSISLNLKKIKKKKYNKRNWKDYLLENKLIENINLKKIKITTPY